MKLRIFFAVLLVAAAWAAGRALTNRGGGAGTVGGAVTEIKAGERVINESHKLAPGARVEVSGIHGPVEVATVEGDTAEVRILTTATDARDLEANKITVEAASDRLVVRGAQNNHGGFWRWLSGRSGSVSHRVEMRVPRRVDLRASGVHGDLTVGALEGSLKVTGVHGDVEAARAVGRAEFTGVHGNVSVGLASLSAEGVRVTGVHGQVDLRFAPDANADVSVDGLHGSVNVDNPRVTVAEDENNRFEGRVGTGGSPVRVSGVHGDVTLARAD